MTIVGDIRRYRNLSGYTGSKLSHSSPTLSLREKDGARSDAKVSTTNRTLEPRGEHCGPLAFLGAGAGILIAGGNVARGRGKRDRQAAV
jgi:hypothetical protein